MLRIRILIESVQLFSLCDPLKYEFLEERRPTSWNAEIQLVKKSPIFHKNPERSVQHEPFQNFTISLMLYFKMSGVYCWELSCVFVVVVVCIVVILCVFAVLCVYCCFYFRCRTAGYKSVFGRFCDQPTRHRFFLVSLCL